MFPLWPFRLFRQSPDDTGDDLTNAEDEYLVELARRAGRNPFGCFDAGRKLGHPQRNTGKD